MSISFLNSAPYTGSSSTGIVDGIVGGANSTVSGDLYTASTNSPFDWIQVWSISPINGVFTLNYSGNFPYGSQASTICSSNTSYGLACTFSTNTNNLALTDYYNPGLDNDHKTSIVTAYPTGTTYRRSLQVSSTKIVATLDATYTGFTGFQSYDTSTLTRSANITPDFGVGTCFANLTNGNFLVATTNDSIYEVNPSNMSFVKQMFLNPNSSINITSIAALDSNKVLVIGSLYTYIIDWTSCEIETRFPSSIITYLSNTKKAGLVASNSVGMLEIDMTYSPISVNNSGLAGINIGIMDTSTGVSNKYLMWSTGFTSHSTINSFFIQMPALSTSNFTSTLNGRKLVLNNGVIESDTKIGKGTNTQYTTSTGSKIDIVLYGDGEHKSSYVSIR